MKIELEKLTVGSLSNNVYLLGDSDSGDAVVIDPSFEGQAVLKFAKERNWILRQIWLTHAHFDHMAGASLIADAYDPTLPIGLHPLDEGWYQTEGGARRFGFSILQPPPASIHFTHGMKLNLGIGKAPLAEVRHTPGHSPGHVMFYCEPLKVLFCGDVIFRVGIGRTDLPGGDSVALQESIRKEVFSLPEDTRLLPGHGPESTVGYERIHNPFIG